MKNKEEQVFFSKDSGIEEEIGKYLSPTKFVKKMFELGEIDEIKKDYSQNVDKLCRNAVAWVAGNLANTWYIYEMNVVEGAFKGKDHCWIEFGDYFVDLTLAQFVDCPKVAIIHKNMAVDFGYEPYEKYEAISWCQRSRSCD